MKMIAVLTLPGLLIAFSTCSFADTVDRSKATDHWVDQCVASAVLGDVIVGIDQALALEDRPASDVRPAPAEAVLPVPRGTDVARDDNLWGEGVIWSEARMTIGRALALGATGLDGRDTSEVVRVKYPKVVMVRDETVPYEPLVKEIDFLDEYGRLKKVLPLQRNIPEKQSHARVVLSENRQYICVNTPYEEGPKDLLKIESCVFDTDGNLIWKARHGLDTVKLSPNGRYFVGENGECGGQCSIKMYGENGKIAEIRRGIREKTERGDSGFRIAFSSDGSYFALITETIVRDKSLGSFVDRLRAHLVVVRENGEELWRREDISSAWRGIGPTVSILEDGTIKVVTYEPDEHMYYFDKEGHELGPR